MLRAATNSLFYNCNEEERTRYFRTFRSRLFVLAYIISEKGRWRVASPSLLLLPNERDGHDEMTAAVFGGGRTPDSLAVCKRVAARHGCAFVEEATYLAPTRISLSGSLTALTSVAATLDIPLIHRAPFQALSLAPDLEKKIQGGILSQPPSGVAPEIYDVETDEWGVGEPKVYDACKYKPANAAVSYFTVLTHGFVKGNDAGEAVFCAAHLQRHTLCTYDADARLFTAPRVFPKAIARALCLCSGRPSEPNKSNNRRVYSNVSQPFADAVLKRLGQGFTSSALNLLDTDGLSPLIHWFN